MGTDLPRQLHILHSGQVPDQVVKLEHKAHVQPPVHGQLLFIHGRNLLPVQKNLSLRQGIHPAENVQQGRLSGTGRSHNDYKLPFFDLKAGIMQGADIYLAHVIRFPHILKFHKGHAQLPLFLS